MNSTTGATVLWLDDLAAADVSLVGGKAANLSRLAVRHSVPPGFCLTAGVFTSLSAAGPEATDIAVPTELRSVIAECYAKLGERIGRSEPRVAVRSSGLDEDGVMTSFAGQFDTFLNLTGVEQLCNAVLSCWASSVNERVSTYRLHHQLRSGAGIAVLVQELVPSDTAAVLFSANPVTGNNQEVVINASFGLGESIVGGTVIPDTYVVRKDDLSIVNLTVARKTRMTVRVPAGTCEVDMPRFLQAQQVWTEIQIRDAARLAIDLEAAMGWPVDVECAYAKSELYLLQCRPITTLR